MGSIKVRFDEYLVINPCQMEGFVLYFVILNSKWISLQTMNTALLTTARWVVHLVEITESCLWLRITGFIQASEADPFCRLDFRSLKMSSRGVETAVTQ